MRGVFLNGGFHEFRRNDQFRDPPSSVDRVTLDRMCVRPDRGRMGSGFPFEPRRQSHQGPDPVRGVLPRARDRPVGSGFDCLNFRYRLIPARPRFQRNLKFQARPEEPTVTHGALPRIDGLEKASFFPRREKCQSSPTTPKTLRPASGPPSKSVQNATGSAI